MRVRPDNERGMILILALWALSLLTVFAVHLNIAVRQKITVLNRLEGRQTIARITDSGVRHAMAAIQTQLRLGESVPTVLQKPLRYIGWQQFKEIPLNSGRYSVWEYDFNLGPKNTAVRYGLSEEASRLNLNSAEEGQIVLLIQSVLAWSRPDAEKLARSIVDWREIGEGEVKGFYSQEYYRNLKKPYDPKKEDFETLDELKLVSGVTEQVFQKLLPFITVYGDGLVNINTAPRSVLEALGLSTEASLGIIAARAGQDGQESTPDDFVLTDSTSVERFAPFAAAVSAEELYYLSTLAYRQAGTASTHFRIVSEGVNDTNGERRRITCVFDAYNGRIAYWKYEPVS